MGLERLPAIVFLIGLTSLQALAAQPFDPFAAAGIDTAQVGQRVAVNTRFTDQHGQPVRIGELLNGQPTVLVPLYFRCPNVCGAALSTLFSQLANQPYRIGRDFQVIAFSFDPREDVTAAREELAKLSQHWPALANEPGLHLLTGDAAASQALARSLGFGYQFDDKQQQYAHSSAVAVLTGDGRLSRWLYGLGYQSDDLRLGLTEAGLGKLGALKEQLLLLCFHYDPQTGTYSSRIIVLLQVAGVATVAVLGLFIFLAVRRDRRRLS
ncbi:SCO family protein [Pseudomonas syringae]|nr:SCO family protein [Pseudomonas syringae]